MNTKTIKLKVSGMTCEHCAASIEKLFENKPGVLYKMVSYRESLGKFEFDAEKITADKIKEIINSTGSYKVEYEINGNEKSEENIHGKSLSNNNTAFDIIIIGGGSAAFAGALKAGELGKRTLIINDGLPIGGTCVNVGCVPSKNLIRAAEEFYLANHPNNDGIKPGNSKIDFTELINRKNILVESLRNKKYIEVIKDDENITQINGHAKFIDRNTVEVNGKNFKAEYIIIATGSSTYIPDFPGLQETNYLTNKNLYDLTELPEHLIIIGGRFIALENAQMFRRLGSKVTVLQRSDRIIPKEGEDLSGALTKYLSEEGIDIKTGVKIISVSESGGKIKITFRQNGAEKLIEGSHLFLATGRKGNTGNLGIDKIGIKLHGNDFIETDEFNRTNVNNIYAAGDVTGEHLFVYTAAYSGSLAVENAITNNSKPKDYRVLPWVIFTDPQVAGVGLDEIQAKNLGINYEVSKIELSDVPRALAAFNTKGFIKLVRNKDSDKLIGARIIAHEGSELLMELSIAIKYGITVHEIRNLFHPYLTLSEGIKLAAITFDKDVGKLSCCAV